MRFEWHLAASVVLGGGMMVLNNEVSAANWLAVIFGGAIIDLVDHGLWGLVNIRPLTVANARKVGWAKFNRMEPGFYFFHTVEVFLVCWWLLVGVVWGKYFMMTYGLHLLMDGAKYLYVWKNWKWLSAWSVIIAVNGKIRQT